jgi:outer membrane protein assembly factor BamB
LKFRLLDNDALLGSWRRGITPAYSFAERVALNTVGQDSNGPKAAWVLGLGSPSIVSLVLVEGLLWLSTETRDQSGLHAELHAVNALDGSLFWSQPLTFEHTMISGLATWEDLGLVSLTSTHRLHGDGALVALDLEGNERWRWAPGVQRVSAPAIDGDTVYINVDARSLVAIDLASGKVKTRVALETAASPSAPAVTEVAAYIPCGSPHLLAVGLNGETRWHFELADSPDVWLEKTPLAIGDRVFAVQSNGIVLALHAENGTLVWHTGVGPERKPLSPLATDGQRLLVGALDGVYALDPARGHEVWRFPTERRVEATPLVSKGVVYVACHDHHLYALDTPTGQELWRYEVQRRIEISPILAAFGEPATPYVIVIDRGGALTAVARPLSAVEHEAAEHWSGAVSIYIGLGQIERAAELLGEHGDPLKAAELWESVGKLERAAQQYEAAGVWQKAAELWCEMGQISKQAEALERYARSLEETACGVEACVAAWEAAAEAFEAEGEKQSCVIACRREIARCLELPIISLDVELEKGLVLNTWSRLKFIARNAGYSPARNLVVYARGEQFRGQVMSTQKMATLYPGRKQSKRLDVYPLEPGDSVPLRVQVDYQDQAGEVHTCEHTIHVSVARTPATRSVGQPINVFQSGGGAVAADGGAVAAEVSGVVVGGDVRGKAITGGHATDESVRRRTGASGPAQKAIDGQKERELDSTRRQLGDARDNLTLIEERKAQYVLEVDVPLQLIKEERRLREHIARLERELGESEAPRPDLPATTHVLSFDRLSPLDFERLCLWLVEREGYTRAEHLGLAGNEQGRDVIAYKPTPDGEELWYFQCKRYKSIGAKTLKDEVDKYLDLIEKEPDLRPVGVVFVISCAVPAKTRGAVGAYCEQHGLSHGFWALTELDMRVKNHPELLREFFNR